MLRFSVFLLIIQSHAQAQFAGGNGEIGNPFQVATPEQLDEVRNHLDAHFIQIADIDLSGFENWEPIGAAQNQFTGTYDGDSHTIANLTIDRENERDIGLFGGLQNGTLSNIILENIDVTGKSIVGGLVSFNEGGEINNISVTGFVTASKDTIGAIAGFMIDGSLSNSTSSAIVNGQNLVGGIIGRLEGGNISEASASGSVNGGTLFVGGLIGHITNGTIEASSASGDVQGNSWVGGLAGSIEGNSGLISSSFSTGDVTGITMVAGGLVGMNNSFVIDSYARGDVTGGSSVGGLIGTNNLNIRRSYSTGEVSGNTNVGGLVGRFASGQILHSYWDVDASGLTESAGGAGLENWQMTGPVAEIHMDGFDFQNIWMTTDEYPELRLGEIEEHPFAGGSGTADDPYQVANQLHLNRVRNHLDAHFIQIADIDLSDFENWLPIGTAQNQFTGTYIGNGYVIANLTIERENEDGIGLFGHVVDGVLENITLEDVDVLGKNSVGGLVGWNEGGDLKNISVSGSVTGIYALIGGVAGMSKGTMSNIISTVSVTGNESVGGVAGSSEGDVFEVTSSGNVTGDFNTGGLIGLASGESIIKNSFAEGTVAGGSQTGGLIGGINDSDALVTDSYATGNVSSAGQTSSVGGLIGFNRADIHSSYAEGNVNGGGFFVGGLIGSNSGDISQSFATGDVSGGWDHFGGLIGWNSGDISESFATGDVFVNNVNNVDVGGLLGRNSGIVSDSYARGNVNGANRVGGLIGRNLSNIARSYSSGEVTGNQNVGGLVGQEDEPDLVTDSYWDEDASGQTASAGGTGLTTDEMTGQAAEEHMTGFDFQNIWISTDEYPELRMEEIEEPPFAGGSGTLEDPYQIINGQHLNNVRDSLNAHFIQLSDINIAELNSWIPIGSDTNPFTGSYNGDHNSIHGLAINRPGENNLGLFGYISDSAVLTGVVLEDVAIVGNDTIGGLVGYIDGGLVTESSVSGNITGQNGVGGLAGYNDGGTIEYSLANVELEGSINAGGLAGANIANGIIRNSYARGNVTANENAGGLAGYVPSGTIEMTYSSGAVNGNDNIGGLIGSDGGNNPTIASSYWDVNASGQTTSAGGTGLATGQMTGPSAANNMTGFDFDETWAVTQSYPRLRWDGSYEVAETVAELVSAINRANKNRNLFAIIELLEGQDYIITRPHGSGDWGEAAGLPLVTSEIIIRGNGATIARWNYNDPETHEDPDFFDRVFRIMSVGPTGDLVLENVTIANGLTAGGEFAGKGAGIHNDGKLTLINSTVRDNRAGFSLPHPHIGLPWTGGGIYNNGELEVIGSTIRNNFAGWGAGIVNRGWARIENSTISGNNAEHEGGALMSNDPVYGVYPGDITTIISSTTISNNTADERCGGIYIDRGDVTITATLVAGNIGKGPDYISGDICGELQSSSAYNLIGDGSGLSGINDGDNGNMIGTAEEPINPLLGNLADNDGLTLTHALLVNSPAINAIPLHVSGCGDTIASDQRGVSRPQGKACDIGAFEADGIFIVLWTFSTETPIGSSPVVGSTVYFGAGDYNLYAIDERTGSELWRLTTGDEVFSSPALHNDVVYVGSNDGNLYAVDAQTGDEVWSYETGDAVRSSPAVAGEYVYVGSSDNHLHAVNIETGAMEWSFQTGDAVESSPAVAGGVVYVGSFDGKVYALDTESGAAAWTFTTGGAVVSSPAVSGGMVYIGSDDGHLYAIDAATGNESWNFTTGGAVQSSPSAGNNLVYFGSDDHHLYALNRETGEEVWRYETGGSVFSSPVTTDEMVLFGSDDGQIYALEKATGRELWSIPTGGPVRSSPAVAYGNVYVGSDDGGLYAAILHLPTSIQEIVEHIVEDYLLAQNYPNPFNPSTVIEFKLPEAGNVELVVFDILGRRVATLVNAHMQAGHHHVTFNAGNLASGIYIYRIQAGDFIDTRKLTLLK